MNRKKKGDRVELEVFKIFESKGYLVEPAHRTMRRIFVKGKMIFVSQRNDIYQMYDGMALKCDGIVFFQVKSDPSDVSKAKPAIEEFKKKYCNDFITCEIWLKVPRIGFVIYIYSRDGYEFAANPDFEWKKEYFDLKGEPCQPFKINGGQDKK